MNFKEVDDIYQEFLDRGYTHDKICVVVSTPYLNHYTIKGYDSINLRDFDDDDYWMNKSQEIREKLKDFQFVHFCVRV